VLFVGKVIFKDEAEVTNRGGRSEQGVMKGNSE
jgi:hypothetical protein